MFKVNDTVLYGNDGVCLISDIMTRKFTDKTMDYYVLKPIYNKSATTYVPVNNNELVAKMRRILSAEEIIDLIHSMDEADTIWIANDNVRKEKYREIINSGDRKQMMMMVKTLFLHQQKLKDQGKKFHATDDRIFKEAEKILYEEFAYVLNIKQEEVIPFINQQIEVKIKERA